MSISLVGSLLYMQIDSIEITNTVEHFFKDYLKSHRKVV